jgi:hypothetical protein
MISFRIGNNDYEIGCGCIMVFSLLVALLLGFAFSNFGGGLFQEPYTGGWLLCLAGKCIGLP